MEGEDTNAVTTTLNGALLDDTATGGSTSITINECGAVSIYRN